MIELSAHAMRRSHETAHGLVHRLVDRGREEKTFRTDVSATWLVTSFFALVHAARDEVLAGNTDRAAALRELRVTLSDLFSPSARERSR